MIRTRLTDLLGIEHPVMLAGMGGVSYSALTAAVSEAGGIGTLGAGSMSFDDMVAEMAATRALTTKPFGVDLLTAMPIDLDAHVQAIIDGGASMFVAALGVPVWWTSGKPSAAPPVRYSSSRPSGRVNEYAAEGMPDGGTAQEAWATGVRPASSRRRAPTSAATATARSRGDSPSTSGTTCWTTPSARRSADRTRWRAAMSAA